MSEDKALKYDEGKPRLELIPPGALLEVAKGFTYGATKYSDWNWTNGLSYSRLIRAALGHILAFQSGEDIDPESGVSHLGLAGCNIFMLFEMCKLHPELDNRFHQTKPDPVTLKTSSFESVNWVLGQDPSSLVEILAGKLVIKNRMDTYPYLTIPWDLPALANKVNDVSRFITDWPTKLEDEHKE